MIQLLGTILGFLIIVIPLVVFKLWLFLSLICSSVRVVSSNCNKADYGIEKLGVSSRFFCVEGAKHE